MALPCCAMSALQPKGGTRLSEAVCFFQFRGARLAAHLDRLAADPDFDGVVVELTIASSAGSLCHEAHLHEHPKVSGEDHEAIGGAVRFFSDLALQRGLPESGRRTPVSLAEGGAEMTVTGEAKMERQGRQVIVLAKQIERSREPQPQLIAIERHAFDPLEGLREIDRRSANLCGNLMQRPAPREIAGQHQFYAIDQALLAETGTGGVRCARPEGTLGEHQGQALGLQGLGNALVKTM